MQCFMEKYFLKKLISSVMKGTEHICDVAVIQSIVPLLKIIDFFKFGKYPFRIVIKFFNPMLLQP